MVRKVVLVLALARRSDDDEVTLRDAFQFPRDALLVALGGELFEA